jgi:thiamine kinase-like enzyme
MCLTQLEIVPYLLNRGFIKAEQVVDGELAVVDVSRRNCNFQVASQDGPSYLIKQGIGPEGLATVAHEASVYRYLQSKPSNRVLNSCLPVYHNYDENHGVLILQLVSNAESLCEYHARRHRFPVGLAAQLGTVLAKLHSSAHGQNKEDDQNRHPSPPPWILLIHRPPLSALREISGANLELIRIVQSSTELCQNLDELRLSWRTNAFIHQDLKGDNIVVFAKPGSRARMGVKIVDWECARYGDPCWDVGSLLSDYLCSWLFSIPNSGDDPPERSMQFARYPLEKIQPAMLAFWKSYRRAMQLDFAISQRWLIRAVRYAAARMLQTAFENLQHATRVTSSILHLMQVSSNILEQPREASIHVFGIPLPLPAE